MTKLSSYLGRFLKSGEYLNWHAILSDPDLCFQKGWNDLELCDSVPHVFFVDHSSTTNLVLHREMVLFSVQWHQVWWRFFGGGSSFLSLRERVANEGKSTTNWRFMSPRTCRHSLGWILSLAQNMKWFLIFVIWMKITNNFLFSSLFLRKKKPPLAICWVTGQWRIKLRVFSTKRLVLSALYSCLHSYPLFYGLCSEFFFLFFICICIFLVSSVMFSI